MKTVNIGKKDLAIEEIKGPNKMAFILDGQLKRQIVFKPAEKLAIEEIKGSNKMAFILDGQLKRQIVFKPV